MTEVVHSNLGTIIIGLDAVTESTGVIGGSTNGIGNLVYSFSNNGDNLTPILAGTEAGQPFLPLATQSLGNSTVLGGIGYGRSFPAVAFTNDDGENWQPSSTMTNDAWVFLQDVGKSNDNSVYVGIGAYIKYCNTPPCPYTEGAHISSDGGDVWHLSAENSWPWDAWSRYGAFLNSTHGLISGGYWPASTDFDVLIGEEDKINTAVIPLTMHIGLRTEPGAVPEKYAAFNTVAINSNGEKKRRQNEGYHAFIASTTDGGETYTQLYSTYDDVYFNQIQCVDANVCFVVGESNTRGVIMKTEDGGRNWRDVFETTRSLVALKMVNAFEGWAGGAIYGPGIRAYLAHTTDGGNTWAEIDVSDIPYSVFTIDGVDPSLVYATGLGQSTCAMLRYTN